MNFKSKLFTQNFPSSYWQTQTGLLRILYIYIAESLNLYIYVDCYYISVYCQTCLSKVGLLGGVLLFCITNFINCGNLKEYGTLA